MPSVASASSHWPWHSEPTTATIRAVEIALADCVPPGACQHPNRAAATTPPARAGRTPQRMPWTPLAKLGALAQVSPSGGERPDQSR
jgi:hypothetical protein